MRIHYSFINLVVCVCVRAFVNRLVDLALFDTAHLVRTLHVIMSRQTPFQDKHVVEYGLQPVQRSVGGMITIVQCLFCVHIGHEKHEGPSVKCQRTKNTQLFQFPFRPKAYKNQGIGSAPRDANGSRQDVSWCVHQRSSGSIPRAFSQTLERGPD